MDVMGLRQMRCLWDMEVLFLSVESTDQLCFGGWNRAMDGQVATH